MFPIHNKDATTMTIPKSSVYGGGRYKVTFKNPNKSKLAEFLALNGLQ